MRTYELDNVYNNSLDICHVYRIMIFVSRPRGVWNGFIFHHPDVRLSHYPRV